VSIQEDYQARLGAWSDIQDCLERLHDAAAAIPRVRVLELGVRSGNSTAAFLAAAEKADGHVWSVDIEPPAVPQEWALSTWWTFALGDDLLAYPLQPEFDILFIDSSHRYAHTLAELRKFVPMVVPGGRILLHDTRLRNVDGEPVTFPVRTAVDLFCAEAGLSWTDHDARYGLGEIVIPGGTHTG
jgi:predicted O-methyltransferase YrrM